VARHHLNVILDPELEAALQRHIEASGIDNRSAVVRDLLRHALGVVPSERSAGWREGYNAAVAAVQKSIGTALRDVPTPD
jgi:metal-responsive CopG/Arc/MetJ family transcriptional regulator